MNPRLKIKILNHSFNSFHFFGLVGYILGLTLGLFLTYNTGLAIWPTLLCALIGAGVLIGLTLLYKKITGREDLVYYQHELAILSCCLLALLLLDQPVLKYLDITLVSIGVFLTFGRMGCFSVGCCHGRPHKKGVLYSKAHVEDGFPDYYEGVRIFPIQLVESASAVIIVIVGVYLILNGYAPGTALLVYSIIYGLIRFVLEFFRGDPERPYWLDFSEAQWTTLGIFLLSIGLSFWGVLPYYAWHLWIVGILIVFMVGTTVFIRRQSVPTYRILQPQHVSEIATGIEALETHTPPEGELLMAHTSLGLKISKGEWIQNKKRIIHYTLSKEETQNGNKNKSWQLNKKAAEVVGALLQTLRHAEEKMEIIESESNVFHVVFTKDQPGNHTPPVEQSIALEIRRSLRHIYN